VLKNYHDKQKEFKELQSTDINKLEEMYTPEKLIGIPHEWQKDLEMYIP